MKRKNKLQPYKQVKELLIDLEESLPASNPDEPKEMARKSSRNDDHYDLMFKGEGGSPTDDDD